MSDAIDNSQAQAPPETAAVPGVHFARVPDPRTKSPFVACVLSAMPGLGQVYVGYYQRGFINALVVASLITLLVNGLGALQPLGAIFLAFFFLYNIIDAGRRAMLYNQALAGGSEVELPSDFNSVGVNGSVIGGVAVALVGLVLLSNTAFDFSLDWLEDWWPLALIAFGGYLVYQANRDRSTTDESDSPLD